MLTNTLREILTKIWYNYIVLLEYKNIITQDSTPKKKKKKNKKEKVNEYFKGNDLKNIFKNFL